ncbi:MAG: amidinotransferase [Bacteroidota bacterium]|nr:amidinotransferase [Bacteroidota bacterium]
MHITHNILMIRPARFMYNAQTAINNSFQQASDDSSVHEKAAEEFDAFVHLLRSKKINVTVIQDTEKPFTPDSIFPNNWVSFHEDGTVFLYPMFAENRRLERKPHVLKNIAEKFFIQTTTDLSYFEDQHKFLEGTGSMVLDRHSHIAYACLSQRTDKQVLNEWCEKNKYQAIGFHANDTSGNPIYHTNVMMCVADEYAIVCMESISDEAEKKVVESSLSASQKRIITISIDQMNHFAGNMLQVENTDAEKFLVMSSQAYQSLTYEQRAILEKLNPIIHSDLSTIEKNGGGSARCMMAEIFLPERS